MTCLCGCTAEVLEGQQQVEKAKESFSKMKSGVITVTNMDNGEIEQTLTFKYDEVGILLYSLTGVSKGEIYEKYCNGYEIYTFENNEFSKLTKADWEYEAYTYDYRYPMTDEDYLFFSPDKVISVSVSDNDKGGKSYSYEYEPSAISGEAELGALVGFTVSFNFDENDVLDYLEELSVYEKDGNKTSYNYKITITERDSVGKIQMPENIAKMSENK
ncbi:MAG: hypothetical protein E7509_02880 [Ruminococcus sp.]|nr:hypothetical protein [Ruminococcus sp.]